jgi:FAD:protein FMN transferase
MNRRKFLTASLGLGALAATAGVGAALERYELSGLALGTQVSLLVLHDDAAQARAALAEAMAEIKAVDALMSLHRDDSQIVVLNRDGALKAPDARVLEVLRYSQTLSALTRGAFDITVQPLWELYANTPGGLPPAAEVESARARVDWRRLYLTAEEARLAPGMAVTLNGVAQGYAADRALAALRSHGVAHALIDAGEFDTLGRKRDGSPWVLGIRHPRDPDSLAARLVADGRALATSGDYETFITPDFRHHHIFDPATGDSPPDLASVTVLAPDALVADGLSTAFMVLGAAQSLALAATLPGVDALLIDKAGRRFRTPGLPEAAA